MPATPPIATRLKVGVFDSGVGGLSVLRALREQLPAAHWHYVADSANAPYSDLGADDVRARSLHITRHLIDHGARAVVVACNTATALAIDQLRAQWPGLSIVGVEPGLKPALALTRNGRVGVMATPATLRSERFLSLMQRHAPDQFVHLQGCDGLAAEIELGELESPTLAATIERHCSPLRRADVDTVVLGCTHYPFVRRQIQAHLGDSVVLVDTASAVARHTRWLCEGFRHTVYGIPSPAPIPTLQTSGNAERLARIATSWLDFDVDVGPLPPLD